LKTYVRSRRLARALDALAHTDERILEIARYRKSHQSIPFLRKARFDEDYLCHPHGGVSLEPDVSVQPARFMVGLSTRFFGSDSEKNNFGAKLPKLRGAFMPRLPEIAREQAPTGYGVIQQVGAHTDELEYLAAIDVAPDAVVSQGMVRFELPEARYATFRHRGHLRQLDQTVTYIYSSWLARSGLRHTCGPDIVVYGPGYHHESANSEVLYAIPVAPGA
jgi:AraC family transcriptional regulator